MRSKKTLNIFSDIKIIDLTKVFSGPLATRYLADYGAEVIKIESVSHPDDSRNYPPLKNNWSGYYEILNRNKKSIFLDLKKSSDLQILYKLIPTADVFVENMNSKNTHKLKIDYKTLKKLNPTIIYVSISGLNNRSSRKYYDIIAQAESGLISLSGTAKTPMKIGPSVVDAFSGINAAFSIAAALYNRKVTSQGQYIEISMLGCSMNLLESNLIGYSVTGKNPPRRGNNDNAIAPFGVFPTRDGYVAIAAGNDKLWHILSNFLKTYVSFKDALFSSNTSRLLNNTALSKIITKVTLKFNSIDFINELNRINIPCARVAQMSDVTQNSFLFKNNYLKKIHHPKLGSVIVPGFPIKFHQHPVPVYNHAPILGADNKRYGIKNS